MSNFDRVVKTLNYVDEVIDRVAGNEVYATALEAAGLLMPDLPEPDSVKLNGDVKFFVGTGKQVRYDKDSEVVQVMVDSPPTLSEARELALSLLAAADYAEKEQGNE